MKATVWLYYFCFVVSEYFVPFLRPPLIKFDFEIRTNGNKWESRQHCE